ncbi:hypothetical protein C8J55DRAFT_502854 [Lentinula edodes]|uniref:Uncharacterized protein n=1 Tax=Lentinula lateritia TaxID=40482 RepID=A0A9W9AXL7_9AGAR|nr:hypothetical protein C8J55DRAFT_502854 [Lentinula edodes]
MRSYREYREDREMTVRGSPPSNMRSVDVSISSPPRRPYSAGLPGRNQSEKFILYIKYTRRYSAEAHRRARIRESPWSSWRTTTRCPESIPPATLKRILSPRSTNNPKSPSSSHRSHATIPRRRIRDVPGC